jgi:hypothetical protein
MSNYVKKQNVHELEEVGKLLANRLHEARKKKGRLICPVCHISFDGTYRIKCPECRTLISNAFHEIRPQRTSKKMERRSERTSEKKKVGPERTSGKMELDFFA